jgi:hypothetical protein
MTNVFKAPFLLLSLNIKNLVWENVNNSLPLSA